MTLSTPVKIVVLAALALALGLGGLLLVVHRHASPAATPPAAAPARPAAVHHAAAPARPAPKPKPKIKFVLLPGLPAVIALSLIRHPITVVAVYNSRTPGDRAALVSARAGAREAHAGFVAADVSHQAVANAIAIWASSTMNPAILVVKRPGTIVFGVAGPSDKDAIAQAVANAR